MTTRSASIPEERRSFTDPEGTAMRSGDPEPNDGSVPADEEAEEMAILWAADPGNQGA